MYGRLVFPGPVFTQSGIVLLDEVFTVRDESFRVRDFEHLKGFQVHGVP